MILIRLCRRGKRMIELFDSKTRSGYSETWMPWINPQQFLLPVTFVRHGFDESSVSGSDVRKGSSWWQMSEYQREREGKLRFSLVCDGCRRANPTHGSDFTDRIHREFEMVSGYQSDGIQSEETGEPSSSNTAVLQENIWLLEVEVGFGNDKIDIFRWCMALCSELLHIYTAKSIKFSCYWRCWDYFHDNLVWLFGFFFQEFCTNVAQIALNI